MLSLQGLAGMDSSKIGMHSYEELLGVVGQITPGELSTAFARIVFNIAAVNYDDSTRNFSFLMDSSGKWSLAPAYDLTFVSSYKHSELNAHKMSVGGKFTGVKVGDLVALAKEFKIKGYLEIIERVDEAVSIWPYFATQAGVDLGRSNFIRDEIATNGVGHLT